MKPEIKSIVDNLISLIIVFLVISTFLILIGSSPFEVYLAFIDGAFGNTDRFARTLLTTAILSISAFALVVTFTGGLWNIGIEGQLVAGSIGATVIARSFIGETVAAPVFEILFGSLCGSLIAVFCGILKVRTNVHEIFGGLGLDFVAAGAIVYLVIGPWKREGIASTSGTDIFPETAWIQGFGEYGLPVWPIMFALIVGGSLLFCFKRTSFGLRLKAVGSNPESSQRFGIEPGRYLLYAFALAGAIGGIAGVVQATVVYHKLVPFISGGYGFLGILIALISSRNIVLVVVVSIVFACLLIGGTQLQLKLGMHSSLSGIIQGLLVLTWILIKASKLDSKLTRKILTRS